MQKLRGEADITVVIGSLNRGGCETHLLRVLPRLDRTRFSPRVFVLAERGELAADMEAAGVPVIAPWLPSDGWPRGLAFRTVRLASVAAQLALHLLFTRPRIVHAFLPGAYLVAMPLAMLAGIRRRVMSRRSLNVYQTKRPVLAKLERWLHRHMSAVVGNSRAVVNDLMAEGVDPARVHLIHNGVTPPTVQTGRDDVRAALGIDRDSVVLTMVANLIPYKGHADLLAALAGLPPEPTWHCLVVGADTGLSGALKRQAEAEDIAARVHFLGGRSDVGDLYAATDIGVLASHEEGFSNAVLEGMSMGLPMVVTDVGGNAEAVEAGASGMVVPPRAPAALRDALSSLIHDANLRRSMGAAARRRAEALFSMPACVAAYEALYDQLLSKGAPQCTAARL